MTHIWMRAEQRENETRTGLSPQGAAELIASGFQITVEASLTRVIPSAEYAQAGCAIVPEGSWPSAPKDAIILGLKELPADGTPLVHRHIMFGHAFKGQPDGKILLSRFRNGGGTLLDLEYLTDDDGRRVAAFGYWAGFAGAAIAVHCWIAQKNGSLAPAVTTSKDASALTSAMGHALQTAGRQTPHVIIIGAHGRVGAGAQSLCNALGVTPTLWDINETAHGGPFPEILAHDIFLNCILASPATPVFVPARTVHDKTRQLCVIGDIACDPTSAFSPIKVYSETTTWDVPAIRVCDAPPLDVTAIDNLPSLLPLESSLDFAEQLLPNLALLADPNAPVWQRANTVFADHQDRYT